MVIINDMVSDKRVSFRIAKKLKAIGFDVVQRYGNETSLYSKSGEHIYYMNYGFMYSGLNDGYISAPTQSYVAQWFEDNYKLMIDLIYTPGNDVKWSYLICDMTTGEPVKYSNYRKPRKKWEVVEDAIESMIGRVS